MNEKCPMPGCDGEIGFQSFYIGDGGSPTPIFLECSECGFRCNSDDLPRIAAAMELARAAVWADECEAQRDYMDDTTSNHDAWRSIVNLELDAHHKACDALDSVLEVFGGE